jgi:hypothetical protein
MKNGKSFFVLNMSCVKRGQLPSFFQGVGCWLKRMLKTTGVVAFLKLGTISFGTLSSLGQPFNHPSRIGIRLLRRPLFNPSAFGTFP